MRRGREGGLVVEGREARTGTEPGFIILVDPSGKLAAELREVLRQVFPAPPARERAAEPPRPAARLTPREIEVLALVALQRSNCEIARDLWVSQETVRFHLRNAYRKLGVHRRDDAVAQARVAGLFEPHDAECG
jgi:DNA-binding CsgD family transcriptional regulator